jgi:acetyl-CoA synthetase
MTHEYVFDYRPGEVYWCTADVGWVTGHSYIVYGPLANGATTLMFEGVPNYPDAGRFWQVVDKHRSTSSTPRPTAIRALMREGDEPVKKHQPPALRLLGSVGEPINPEAWEWYHKWSARAAARSSTPGGRPRPAAMITPLPGATTLKPGSATRRSSASSRSCSTPRARCWRRGVRGQPGASPTAGRARCAPSGAITSASSRPISAPIPASTFTGDGCRRDEDGYYWITGRVDDVINVSGHRMGTAEVESALVAHAKVAEAAVVGYPARHQGPGHLRLCHAERRRADRRAAQGTGRLGAQRDRPHRHARRDPVRARPAQDPLGQDHAPHPAQDRRGDTANLGDTSTLADPSVVETLINSRAVDA